MRRRCRRDWLLGTAVQRFHAGSGGRRPHARLGRRVEVRVDQNFSLGEINHQRVHGLNRLGQLDSGELADGALLREPSAGVLLSLRAPCKPQFLEPVPLKRRKSSRKLADSKPKIERRRSQLQSSTRLANPGRLHVGQLSTDPPSKLALTTPGWPVRESWTPRVARRSQKITSVDREAVVF
jgi:hypothetical protein